MEQAYDSKSGWEWKQDCRTWDRLEALTLMCFYAHRTRKFRLTRYIMDFAAYFGCSPRTIRRALKDGCYYREEVFGTNVERIAFFSAERMEIKEFERERAALEMDFFPTLTPRDKTAADEL